MAPSTYIGIRYLSRMRNCRKKQINNSSCYVLELISRDRLLLHHLSNHFSNEKLRQLLQTISPSKMLAIYLCLDVLFVHFNQSANKPSARCQLKSYVAPPNRCIQTGFCDVNVTLSKSMNSRPSMYGRG